MSNIVKKLQHSKQFSTTTSDKNQFLPSRFVKSSLFNEVFVLRDIDKELPYYWSNEESSGFMDFWTHLCMFAKEFNELGEEKFSWNYRETMENMVLPMLEILGHGELDNKGLDHFLSHEEFEIPVINGNTTKLKIPLLISKSSSAKTDILNSKNKNDSLSELRKKSALPVTVDYFDSWADSKINKYNTTKAIDLKLRDEYSYLEKEIQCAEYLNLLDKDFGISTDGARWRIIHKSKTKEDASLFYEFDLLQFLELFDGIDVASNTQNEMSLNCAKWFFWFFSKEGICGSGLSFLSEVESRTRKYADHIEEDMKTRFVYAVTLSVNGYLESFKNSSKSKPDLDLIVTTSESLIFNLFFLRSCESKGIIPFHQDYKKNSLANLISKIEYYKPTLSWTENLASLKSLEGVFGKTLAANGFEVYDHVHKLFEVIKNGDNGFQIQGFIETVFEKAEFELYSKYKLCNKVVLGLLYELMFYRDQNSMKEIPYNTFTSRQLGSIYESFLEYKPVEAKTNLYYVKKESIKNGKKSSVWSWQKKSELPNNISSDDLYVVKQGEYVFAPNDEDRKSSGVYYTPHYIVENIVKNAIGARTSKLTNSKDLLDIKICDPAMGSAHFLVESLNFLYREYLRISPVKTFGSDIKRLILQSCIFGVDINPRAVKLAKMSLWLATSLPGKSLEHLDDQLKVGDSLDMTSFNWNKQFELFKQNGGFDVVVGNPPYVENSKGKLSEYSIKNLETYNKSGDLYVLFVELGAKILNPKGTLGYIIPHKFFIADYGEKLRSHISTNNLLHSVIDFEHHQIFSNVMTYTCLLFLDKAKNDNFVYSNLKTFECSDYLFKDNLNVKSFPGNSIDGKAWNFSHAQVFDNENCLKMKDVSEQMYQGLATTCDPVFILKEINGKFFSKHLGEYIEIEKEILKPIFRGKEIKRYVNSKNTEFVIFPYIVESLGEYSPIEIDELKKSYPKTFKYLSKCRNKLDMRENGKYAKIKNWHLYTQEHNLGYFDVPKIITKVMSKEGCFSVDKAGRYYFVGGGTAGGYGIVLKKKFVKDINLIVAILNSKFIFELTKKKNSVFKGGYYSYSKKTLNDIPLKIEDICPELRNEIESVVIDIQKHGYTPDKQKTIDSLVSKLYQSEDSHSKQEVA
jgi:type I restriction-modification system DNA methylase subunit